MYGIRSHVSRIYKNIIKWIRLDWEMIEKEKEEKKKRIVESGFSSVFVRFDIYEISIHQSNRS